MVREIHGAKINKKLSIKSQGAQNMRERKLREHISNFLLLVVSVLIQLCFFLFEDEWGVCFNDVG
jgi:hypothetical protein